MPIPAARVFLSAFAASLLAAAMPACSDATPTSPAGPAPAADANPLAGMRLWGEADGPARRQAVAWQASRPADAALMHRIADQPQAVWLGEWNRDVRADVDRLVGIASGAGALPVLVAYNIPQRDCGGLSGGGGATPSAYRTWIRAAADGLRGRPAIVILEPDALPMLDCLSDADRRVRLELLNEAVGVLARAGATVYIDAGHARWHSVEETVRRLEAAGVRRAAGFSLNVSNFIATGENVSYGDAISARLGGRGYVVDTSRNGRGAAPDNGWCNPDGRGLGQAPTSATGHAAAHAFLWIKRPGESDGACNGGPPAGEWWAEYALGLAQRAAF
jgi:endoglucanase